jgi:CRP-like cAMP-binding protein
MRMDTVRARSTEFGAVVARGFAQFAALNDDENTFLFDQATNVQRFAARAELVEEESDGATPLFLLSGWACRARSLADGRRQILEFLLPGDLIPGGRALAASYALTAVTVAPASKFYQEAFDANGPFAHFATVRHALERLQEMRLINQIVRAGRQTAYERLAHLLLEFHDRLGKVGLANDNTFAMPLTQEMLADGLGLSVVHVNRTLQQLRREHLLTIADGVVTLLEPAALSLIADFKPMV